MRRAGEYGVLADVDGRRVIEGCGAGVLGGVAATVVGVAVVEAALHLAAADGAAHAPAQQVGVRGGARWPRVVAPLVP